MSTTPIFSIEIDYLDNYGYLQTVIIPMSENQHIELRLLADRKFIRDKGYLVHNKEENKLLMWKPK